MIKYILYLGTDPSRFQGCSKFIHLPLVRTCPRPISAQILENLDQFTHVLLTSPNAVRILLDALVVDKQAIVKQKGIFAIGMATAAKVKEYGLAVQAVASPETQEGMMALLKTLPLDNPYFFYPRSSIARPLLGRFLEESGFRHQIYDLYDTFFERPSYLPPLEIIEEIIFTSPSTVKAFMALYGSIPKHIKRTCIGPITEEALQKVDGYTQTT